MRPARLAPLVLLALLASGCSTPRDGGDDSTPTPGPTSTSIFQAPVPLGTAGGPEPVVGVGGDGAVWVAAQDAGGGAPRVWTSTDGAKTFRESRPSSLRGGEVDLAAGTSAAYVTQLGPSGNLVSYSRDKGASWQQSTFAGTNYFERELVAVDRSGSVYLASRFGLRQLTGATADEDATVARSDDSGITFVPGGRIWDADHEPGTSIGNMIPIGSALGLAYNCRDGQAVCFAKSADRGLSWTQKLVVARSVVVANVYPVLAADGDRLVVVWSDASEGRLGVYGATSSDGGSTWTQPALVSEAAETATLPWVAAGGGRIWVVYVSTDVALADAGDAAAQSARWTAKAARVDAGLAVAQRGSIVDEPVHEGVISKPLGRPGQGGPFDRRFGDLFTVAVDPSGRAYVAVQRTTGSGTIDLLVVSR